MCMEDVSIYVRKIGDVYGRYVCVWKIGDVFVGMCLCIEYWRCVFGDVYGTCVCV